MKLFTLYVVAHFLFLFLKSTSLGSIEHVIYYAIYQNALCLLMLCSWA